MKVEMENSLSKKFLKPWLAQRLIDFHLKEAGIQKKFMADISKSQLHNLTKSLFQYPIGKTTTEYLSRQLGRLKAVSQWTKSRLKT